MCEQQSHQQIGVDHGWKIIEMTLFQKKNKKLSVKY